MAQPRIDLVAVTGASNVTGEVSPLAELAAVAHHYGAELFVDAAQLAPHRAIDMAGTGIDYLALSGHKLYAPLGPARSSPAAAPSSAASRCCTAAGRSSSSRSTTSSGPTRPSATRPDRPTWWARSRSARLRILGQLGMQRIAARERALSARLAAGLASVPGLQPLTLWSDPPVDRVGLATFNLEGYRHPLLAAILSAEHAIGVRHGCFCAHPLLAHLLGVPAHELDASRGDAGRRPAGAPGAVRASFGLGTTAQDVDRLVDAVAEIARSGPRWGYVRDSAHDEYRPAPDVRALPRTPRYEPAAASASARPLRS